jgi:multiple sugar transport system substrate-binding protein
MPRRDPSSTYVGVQLSRRSLLLAALASAGTGLVAACSGGGGGGTAAQPTSAAGQPATGTATTAPVQAQEKVQLRYSHWGNADEKASTRATLDAFEKANPNITVEQNYIPDAGDPYLQKMTAMAASDSLPDAALFPDAYTLDWALRGQFLDLSDIFTGDHAKVDAISYKTPDGKTVGVAGAQEIALIWYNQDTFDKAKIPYPPAAVDKAWTWGDFLTVAKQLTVDTKGKTAAEPGFDPQNIDRFGFQMPLWDMPVFAVIRSNGGDVFSEDWHSLTIDTPEVYDAVQQIADLMNKDHVKPAYTTTSGGGGVASMTTDSALLSGKVAMAMDGQWTLETLNKVRKEQGLKFGIGVLPYLKKPVTAAVGGPIIAFKSSKHPDEAKKLVSFIMDPHQTPAYIHGGLWMPNEKRWYSQPDLVADWITNDNHPAEYKTAVLDYSLSSVTRPMPIYRVPGWPGMWQIINPALEQVWLGKATAKDAIQGALPKIKDYFEKSMLPLLK